MRAASIIPTCIATILLAQNAHATFCQAGQVAEKLGASKAVVLLHVVREVPGTTEDPYRPSEVRAMLKLELEVIHSWKGPLRPGEVISFEGTVELMDQAFHLKAGDNTIVYSRGLNPISPSFCIIRRPPEISNEAKMLDRLVPLRRRRGELNL